MAAKPDLQSEELAGIVREIQQRVRARHPSGYQPTLKVALPDLLPLLQARDAAEGKVASIGSVNPRAGGPVNALIQFVKNQIARMLGWFVRDQVEFNRAVLRCVESTLEAMNESNRTFLALAAKVDEERKYSQALKEEAAELKDIRTHWIHWREQWEQKLFTSEIRLLRSVSELQGAFQHRVSLAEANFRDSLKWQHTEFTAAMETGVREAQQRLWSDLDTMRTEFEGLIHNELRVVRQKALAASTFAAGPAARIENSPASAPTELAFDYSRFADRFRGPEEYVAKNQSRYLDDFKGCKSVLDIGCGRGEFLAILKEVGIPARGIDLDAESVGLCRAKGYEAEQADLFEYLAAAPDASFDGIFCSQVVEHLTPDQVPRLVKLCSAKMQRGGLLAIETPNPECLAIFATHFYLDPTHTRPIPAPLMAFYLEEFGFGRIDVRKLAPAVESMPSIATLPEDFRDAFFGGLDYGIIGRKL